MGSYLTIVNDTRDDWHCKVASDTKAIKLTSLVFGVIGLMGGMLAAFRYVVPLSTALVGGSTVTIFGISAANMISTSTMMASDAMAVASQTSQFAVAASKELDAKFSAENYALIPAGNSHQYKKMMLLAWRQGTCMRAVILNTTAVEVLTLLMRPIFSAARVKGTREYRMSWWLRQHPPRSNYIIAAIVQPKVHLVKSPVVNAPLPVPPIASVQTTAPVSKYSETNGTVEAKIVEKSMVKNASIADILSPSLRMNMFGTLETKSPTLSESSHTDENKTEQITKTISSSPAINSPPILSPVTTSEPKIASAATLSPSLVPNDSFNPIRPVVTAAPYPISVFKAPDLREENLNWDFDN